MEMTDSVYLATFERECHFASIVVVDFGGNPALDPAV
jgi:hypothetical protein